MPTLFDTVSDPMGALASQATDDLRDLLAVAWASVDPVELELCRLRIAAMLGDEIGSAERTVDARNAGLTEDRIALLDRWRDSSAFTAREKARLSYTEQFVVSVSSMEDGQIEAMLEDEDHIRVYEFTMAIYVLDMSTRVALMLRSTLTDESIR
jgi:alkylhydroperoxidase family enzyme